MNEKNKEFDIYGAMKQLQNVVKERDAYRDTIRNYKEYSERIRSFASELQEIANLLDPVSTLKSGRVGVNGNNKYTPKVLIEEFHKKMLSGTTVSRDLIVSVYNDITENQVTYIIDQLSKKPRVQKRKEGVKVFLYM